jgi:hypothetical protein
MRGESRRQIPATMADEIRDLPGRKGGSGKHALYGSLLPADDNRGRGPPENRVRDHGYSSVVPVRRAPRALSDSKNRIFPEINGINGRTEILDELTGRTIQPHGAIESFNGYSFCPPAEGACTALA